jgi:hypothetical protein
VPAWVIEENEPVEERNEGAVGGTYESQEDDVEWPLKVVEDRSVGAWDDKDVGWEGTTFWSSGSSA